MKRNEKNYAIFSNNHTSAATNFTDNAKKTSTKKSQDSQEEDFTYEINTTENLNYVNTKQTLYNSLNNNTKFENLQVTEETPEEESDNHMMEYVEKLEKKIRHQAIRLTELEKYRFICEKKIKQLNPNQTFPITESCILKPSNNENEKESSSISEKYDVLHKKYTKLLAEYNELKTKQNNWNKGIISITQNFPEPEKIQNVDKLKENYSNLLNSFKEQMVEKDEILEMLRQETLNSEEQRNVIEVLKQALESDLIQSGFMLKYITLDNVLDFGQLKIELDNYKKELLASCNIISNLRKDNEELKFINENLMKNKDKIKRSLEDGINEMENCKERARTLESEKDGLEEQINLLKDSIIKLTQERDEIFKKNTNLNGKVKEISDLSENQNQMVANRLNEYRLNFEKLNKDFEVILKEKNDLEIKNCKLNTEIDDLKNYLESINDINERSENSIDKSLDFKSIHPNYRKLYEETSIEFEEYKNSHKRISKNFVKQLKKSYNKSRGEIQSEKISMKKENDALKIEVQKLELILQKKTNEFNDVSGNYIKKLEQYDTEIKNFKNLKSEFSTIDVNNEKLKEELTFRKEKYEKDISLKNNEINSLYQQITQLKSENLKLKDNLKSLNEIHEETNEEIEELKQKIGKYEEKILKYNEREADLQSKSEELSMLNPKYEKLIIKLDEYFNELQEKRKENLKLKEENNNVNKTLTNIESEYSNLKLNNERLNKEVEEISGKMLTLANKLKNYECDTDEKEKSINVLMLENNKINKQLEYKSQESMDYKKEYDEILHKYKILQDFKSDMNIGLYPMFSLLKVTIHKFNSSANEDLDSLLTKNFAQNLSKLVSQVNNYTTEIGESYIIQVCCDFIKILGTEFENIYEKLIDSNNYINDSNGKLILLENSLNEISQSYGQLYEKEKKYKIMLKALNDEKTAIENNLIEFKQDSNKEINLLRQEREDIFDELKKVRNDSNIIGNRYDKLVKENQKIVDEYYQNKNNDIRYENNISIFTKEKKYLEGLLNSFVKSYPSKEVSKLMAEVLYINDYIFKTEREKIKIEEKLISLDKEYKVVVEDKDCFNGDLSNIVLSQKDNMKKLIDDYNKRISDKRQIQIHLENEINKLELNVKNIFEKTLNYENEIQHLQDEIFQYKNYFDDMQTNKNAQNIFKNNLIQKSGSVGQNNQIDISCLESHGFSVNNTKSNHIRSLSDHQLTDYDSIELEYTEDINTREKNTHLTPISSKTIQNTHSSNNSKSSSKNNNNYYNSNALRIVNEEKIEKNFMKNSERVIDTNKERNNYYMTDPLRIKNEGIIEKNNFNLNNTQKLIDSNREKTNDKFMNIKNKEKVNEKPTNRRESIDKINIISNNNQTLNPNRRNINLDLKK